MALYEENNVTDEQLNAVAMHINKYLKGRCKFCPRGFEGGEQIVFVSMKSVQMKWVEESVEHAEPAGFGEQHLIDIVNAHLPCAIANKSKLRGVIAPRKLI
jgi:hypothetical protein